MIIRETWLQDNIPDQAVELACHTIYRTDHIADSGKLKGEGVYVYVNNSWCTDSTVIERHCSPDLEFLMIKCRPFYLPREIPAAFTVAVYVHPRANAKLVMDSLYDAISKQLNKYPDCVFIAAGDFNHSNLDYFTEILQECPRFNQK